MRTRNYDILYERAPKARDVYAHRGGVQRPSAEMQIPANAFPAILQTNFRFNFRQIIALKMCKLWCILFVRIKWHKAGQKMCIEHNKEFCFKLLEHVSQIIKIINNSQGKDKRNTCLINACIYTNIQFSLQSIRSNYCYGLFEWRAKYYSKLFC